MRRFGGGHFAEVVYRGVGVGIPYIGEIKNGKLSIMPYLDLNL